MSARLRGRFAVGVLTLLLVVSACGGGDSGGGGGGDGGGNNGGGIYGGGGGGDGEKTGSGGASVLTLEQNNFLFAPAGFSVKSGDTITVKNANANTPHTFTVEDEGIDVVNDTLQSQDVTIDLPPGTYEFICRFHEASGMKGTLTVT